MWRARAGSAVHSWTPCRTVVDGVETSECAMPRPAVMRLSSPGRTIAWVPEAVSVLDLTGEQPAHRLQPGVRVRRHVHPAGDGDVVRPVVVGEAPRADERSAALGKGAADGHRAQPAERDVARGDDLEPLRAAALDPPGRRRRRVGEGAHRFLLRSAPRQAEPAPPSSPLARTRTSPRRGASAGLSTYPQGMSEPATEPDQPTYLVARDDATSRYTLTADGREVGEAEFILDEGRVLFTHTEIAKDAGRSGLGTLLVREALADVRERGLTVVPLCSFVASYLRRHPEEADLAEV